MGRNKNKNKKFFRPKNNNNNNNNNETKDNIVPIHVGDFQWEMRSEEDAFTAEELAFIEKWSPKLAEMVPNEYKEITKKELSLSVFQAKTLNDNKKIAELYRFFTHHPNVAVIKEDWHNELTKGELTGCGFKVTDKRSRFQGDDAVYQRNPILQNLVPRGIVMVQSNGEFQLPLFSNRKFYGRRAGDDDDCDLTSSTLSSGNFSKFIVSEKANGESAQVAYFGNDLWIVGSKNKKIIVKERKDIRLYADIAAYGFATEMAESFFDYLKEMGDDKVAELKELLTGTRWTVNFEFESPDHQHIVELTRHRLVLIGCTGIHVPSGKSSHPITGAAVAKYFGFPSVLNDTTSHPKKDFDEICSKINHGWDTEGSVVILLDDTSNVVDFVKVKAWWYVLLRAIREKVRSLRNLPPSEVYPRIQKRLKEIQRDMEVDSLYISQFSKLGVSFAEWVHKEFVLKGKQMNFIIENYPVLWRQFLQSRNLPSDSSLLTFPLNNLAAPDLFATHSNADLPLLLLPQGIPGIGKSLLAQSICDQLNAEGISAIQVAQDDFAHAGKNSGKVCFEHVQKLLTSKKYQLVILARNNGNFQQYSRYLQLESSNRCRIAFITPSELQTRKHEVLLMCAASVLHRKINNEAHPTTSMPANELASLPLKFMGEYEPSKTSYSYKVMTDAPFEIPPNFPEILKRFEQRGFRAEDLTPSEFESLHLNDPNHISSLMQLHRPVKEMAAECVQYVKEMLMGFVPILGSYYCCSLSKLKSDELLQWVRSKHSIPKTWQIHANHVTLIHSNDFAKQREHWMKVAKYEGQLSTVTPLALLFVPDNACILSVSLKDESCNPIDDLVLSKVPHITIATAPKVKSFQSAATLLNFEKQAVEADFPAFKSSIMLFDPNNVNREDDPPVQEDAGEILI